MSSLWTAKLTVCEFLKRVNGMVWRRSVAVFLRFIHVFLVSTLVAVVIATLAECQPFDHYWQVRPDPGPACRSGYANLITMGACDIITDLLLVAFPVPIILTAHMPWKRKLRLVVLFCLSLILVAITCFRVPSVIAHDGAQPYRSLLASLDILAATAVSNMVVIGSFVRDRGVKKLKYKPAEGSASVTESLDHSYVRRNTVMHRVWGSDSDLAADLGIRLDPKLYSSAPAGTEVDIPTLPAPLEIARTGSIDRTWSFHQTHARSSEEDPDHISASDSLELKISPREYIETNQSAREKKPSTSASSSSCRRVSFFDVGGLLSQDQPQPQPPPNTRPRPHTFFSSPTVNTLEGQRIRRGSRAFLEDIGVLSPRPSPRRSRAVAPPHQQPPPLQSHFSSPPASSQRLFPTPLPTSPASADVAPDTDVELQDVGRLLPPQQRQRRTSRERPSDAI